MQIIKKIISGAQTGADRGWLDAAIEINFPYGGWCPKGRKAEDWKIPDKYVLDECDSDYYPVRTELNVINSDATIVFTKGKPRKGSLLTINLAKKHHKPFCHIDMNNSNSKCIWLINQWFDKYNFNGIILNVAGSRESSCPGIQERVKIILLTFLQ